MRQSMPFEKMCVCIGHILPWAIVTGTNVSGTIGPCTTTTATTAAEATTTVTAGVSLAEKKSTGVAGTMAGAGTTGTRQSVLVS